MPESKRIGAHRLEAAMDRLFRINQIERGFLWRDGGEGKDKIGLRRKSAELAKAPADLPADHPLTGPVDPPLTARRLPLTHTPSTTYYSGAAHGPAAPVLENKKRQPGETCFPVETDTRSWDELAHGDDA